MRIRLAIFAFIFAVALPTNETVAVAQSNARDVSVAVNTFNFVTPSISQARVAVIHDGGASLADAKRIVRSMPSRVRRIQITASAVSASELRGSDANIVILASGLSAGTLSSVRSQLSGGRRLCITTQYRYVESGACVVAVSSAPKVRIIVNNSAARRFGIRFAAALMMMVESI